MHHAYPLECPYPHASGTYRPETQDEWMEKTGAEDITATEEDRRAFTKLHKPVPGELPWMQLEELVTQHKQAQGGYSKLGGGSQGFHQVAQASARGTSLDAVGGACDTAQACTRRPGPGYHEEVGCIRSDHGHGSIDCRRIEAFPRARRWQDGEVHGLSCRFASSSHISCHGKLRL